MKIGVLSRHLVRLVPGILIFVPAFLFAETNITDISTTTNEATKKIHNASEVEEKIRAFFSDIPVMAEIARCESKFKAKIKIL